MKRLRAIDVCCGAGGWAVAARGLPVDILTAVDLWSTACQTYELNHPDTRVIQGDWTKIVGSMPELEPKGYDLVLGGIPCQWLTVLRSAGLGNEVGEAERTKERELLDSVLGFVKALDPPYWCLEDVERIVPELPAFTPHHVLNAELWSGQRRVRAYVGNFPAPEAPLRPCALTAEAYLRPGPWRVHPKNLERVVSTHNTWQNKNNAYPVLPDRKFPTVVTVGSRHDSKSCVVDARKKMRGMLVSAEKKFPTVAAIATHIGGDKHSVLGESGEVRRQIEWQEAALAQGFPDDYVFVGNQSDVSQMVANAVQIDTARAILRSICAHAGLVERERERAW